MSLPPSRVAVDVLSVRFKKSYGDTIRTDDFPRVSATMNEYSSQSSEVGRNSRLAHMRAKENLQYEPMHQRRLRPRMKKISSTMEE